MAKEKLKQEYIQECVKLKRAGVNDKDIAAYIGVRPETFCRWLGNPKTELQHQLRQSLKKAESEAKAAALSKIQEAGMKKGNWQALAWWLERKFPREFARPEVQLQREMMEKNTEQLLETFSDVIVKIRETANEDRADS